MIVLGIETSCDETSAAIVADGVVKSNVISSQLVHQTYGGVVPELASRAHQRLIIQVVDETLARAGARKEALGGVAATYGPGLAGALLVGLNFGKALAYALRVPFVGINHMEGHLYSNFLAEEKPSYPFLSLIVSGGHTMLVYVESEFQHRVLGQTRDDAAGEAFDKVATILKLPYPGGPNIERIAQKGNPKAIAFPRSMLGRDSLDFSFSGLKTAVLYHCRGQDMQGQNKIDSMSEQEIADIAASFQAAVIDVLVKKTKRAADRIGARTVLLGGGVAANSTLREAVAKMCEKSRPPRRLLVAPKPYCTDNAVMVASLAYHKYKAGLFAPLSLEPSANG